MLYVGSPLNSATESRPYTPQQRIHKRHPTISEEELIKKKDLLDPLDDNDDIEWKANPFDADSLDGSTETPEVNVKDYLQRISTTAVAA